MRTECCVPRTAYRVLRAACRVSVAVQLAVTPARRLAAQTPLVTTQRTTPLAPDGYIRVYNRSGSIRVTGWELDSVRWSGHHSARQELFGGGSQRMVKVGVTGGDEPVRLEVQVPKGAKLVIDAGDASVVVEGVVGPVEIRGGAGAVRVRGAPVRLTIETVDGAVTLIGAPMRSTEVRTAGGMILVTGAREEIVLTSVTGAITAEVEGVTRGRIGSVTGVVRFSGGVDPTGTLSVESHGGDVTLALDPHAGVELVATAFGGTIVNTLTTAVPRPVREGRSQLLETMVDGGGGTVTVTAFKGTVHIRTK